MKIAVTGSYSYSGKYITRRLLAKNNEVITLTGHPNRQDPFSGQVQAFSLLRVLKLFGIDKALLS